MRRDSFIARYFTCVLKSLQMRAAHLQVVALLIVALIFGATQCVASCAAEGCGPTLPPCHQHSAPGHATASACTQDFLVPDTHGALLAHGAVLAHATGIQFAAPASQIAPALIVADHRLAPSLLPLDLPHSLSSILRI